MILDRLDRLAQNFDTTAPDDRLVAANIDEVSDDLEVLFFGHSSFARRRNEILHSIRAAVNPESLARIQETGQHADLDLDRPEPDPPILVRKEPPPTAWERLDDECLDV